jgi:hypothetical protein
MDTTPTPQQADDLLAQVEANKSRSRNDDAWPLVLLLFTLSTGLSVGLVAFGLIEDNATQLIIAGAGLVWIIPALVVYRIKALSWSRRSLVVFFAWLGVIMIAFIAGIVVDSVAPSSPVPFIAAGLLWVAAPVLSLLAMRR